MDESEATTPMTDWLKWLGDRRDGFLVGGAVLYGLGYLVWSYNAWHNNLGQLPAIEFQYIMAGLVPGAIIAIAVVGVLIFDHLLSKKYLSKEHYSWLRKASFGVFIIAVAPSLTNIVPERFLPHDASVREMFRQYADGLASVQLICLYLVAATGSPSYRKSTDRSAQYGYPLFFVWMCFSVFLDFYPRLPQVLGGPEPRCAYVDLVRDEMDPSLLSGLLPISSPSIAASNDSKVVQSAKLYVYASSHESMLIRVADVAKKPNGANALRDQPLYELRGEAVRAIRWCSE